MNRFTGFESCDCIHKDKAFYKRGLTARGTFKKGASSALHYWKIHLVF
jgi:hypothetical protein